MNLTGSWLGAVYQVQYVLKVYVKHDGMLQFGDGRCVTMPIKILNTPCITKSDEPYKVPEDWNPIQCNEDPIYLY